MDTPISNTPDLTEPSLKRSNVEDSIPSVVASHQTKNRLLIVGFLIFMLIIAILVGRKPKPATSGSSTDNPVTAFSLPPAPAIPRMNSFEAVVARPVAGHFGEESLLEIRRTSPMMIFNKASAADRLETHLPLGLSGMGGLSLGNSSEGNSNASGVQLPKGFNPTAAASVHATALGERDLLITQGKLIDAILETAINSDHAGMLRAIVSHDIYGDSGRTVLLPRGSRLIGQYDSAVAKGQNRVFVLWERAIRPDGIDIQLASAGTDALGRTGIDGRVNNHFWTMFGAATLLSVIGATASTVDVNPADQNNSIAQYREGLTNSFNNAASTVLGQFAQIKPTITVRQGVAIKVFVARDLYFDSGLASENGVQRIP